MLKYEIIKARLKERIELKNYKDGDAFPSQNQLMRSEKASYSTISRVLKELQNEGLIFRVRGKGTFVGRSKEFEINNSKIFKVKIVISPAFSSKNAGEEYWLNSFEIASEVAAEASRLGLEVEHVYYSDDLDFPKNIKEENSCVFLPNFHGYFIKMAERLIEMNVPFVFHGPMNALNHNYNCVVANVWQGAYDATQTLLKAGKNKIALFATEDIWCRPKVDGVKQAMSDNSKTEDLEIVTVSSNPQEVYNAAISYLNESKPDAIIVYNDESAFKVIDALEDENISIPTEVAVVGFDDCPQAKSIATPLTTVKYPCKAIACSSIELMGAVLSNPSLTPLIKAVPTGLIFRESFTE